MCHSFIIGDLIIDHTIFVRDIREDWPQRGDEGIYEVVRRTDTAGGAANCARILAALSAGQTYLWGLTGRSHWGPFRAILSHSQAIDGSKNNIEFHGIRDETDSQMNTITRLIITRETDGTEGFRFGDRFDETGHLHALPGQSDTATHYLWWACEKLWSQQRGKLDVIVINDFDMGCLTEEVVTKVANFSNNNDIPLFVSPRYDGNKYKNIRGTVMLADLKEWCRLANEGRGEQTWRQRVAGNGELSEMAYRSFHYLGNFEYYVIKCQDAGTVFIGPSPLEKDIGHYAIWKIPVWRIPHFTDPDPLRFHQIGVTDVMTAVFAMEFHRLVKPEDKPHKRTKQAFAALTKANAVVGAYRAMPWHRMPNAIQVEDAIKKATHYPENDLSGKSYTRQQRGAPRTGMLYLPKMTEIVLSDYKTCVSGFYSKPESEYSKSLDLFLQEWSNGDISKHIMLTAPGGCGKTTLLRFLKKEAPDREMQFQFDEEIIKSAVQTDKKISRFLENMDAFKTRVLAFDEALGCGFGEIKFARSRLDELVKHGSRFLLVDADFPTKKQNPSYSKQIVERCREYRLMAPDEHPDDIPLMIAGLAFAEVKGINSIQFQGSFLLAFIDGMLNEPTLRPWAEQMKQAMQPHLAQIESGDPIKLGESDLPKRTKKYLSTSAATVVSNTWFTFRLENSG